MLLYDTENSGDSLARSLVLPFGVGGTDCFIKCDKLYRNCHGTH